MPGQTLTLPPRRHTMNPASMEGRAIARPNCHRPCCNAHRQHRFNGGPGNCPAKPGSRQPGGSPQSSFNGGPGNCPAKRIATLIPTLPMRPLLQWRAGQLPGQTRIQRNGASGRGSLQWRAGQLPGQTALSRRRSTAQPWLQWRAGQLPGQTANVSSAESSDIIRFNGGPGNCPAKPLGDGW